MRADRVIIAPILSEKTNLMREAECKKYVFRVDPAANKFEIMAAVKELFNVECTKCNVMNVGGKPKFSRGKGGYIKGYTPSKGGYIKGYTPSWKKAIVTLAKGQSIQAIEGV